MANILAIRFSALGDVAMTVAVLKAFADQYPHDHITLLSRPVAAALVEGLPQNVHLRTVNLNDYKGLLGLRRLSRELMGEGYDVLVDWHDVLRSKAIRFFFFSGERRVECIDKGRKQRKMLTRRKNKIHVQLTPSPKRYADALRAAGFPIELKPYSVWPHAEADISDLTHFVGQKGDSKWVGIAPFAAHEGKIYPLHLMAQVIDEIMQHGGVRIFLFGSGEQERNWCEQQERAHGGVVSLVGKTNLRAELRLMNNMDAMLTMDSANMHLGALAGTRTVSVWGATHPLAGFGGMQMEGSVQVQLDMECRPCSIFGNKRCRYGDYRCMARIEPHKVAQSVIKCISE
ncbi:MAG: glycosyltransferase family 9 protein [Prevotellaceae bacterium]|nr:glycosyltransferase family 9 protein [Prevotellaceae bacterium]